jgi:hypothetical protein
MVKQILEQGLHPSSSQGQMKNSFTPVDQLIKKPEAPSPEKVNGGSGNKGGGGDKKTPGGKGG